jgi:hypothetical protein
MPLDGGADSGDGAPDGGDTTAPEVASVTAAANGTSVTITFSEAVQPPTSVTPGDFMLSLSIPYSGYTVYYFVGPITALSQPGSTLEIQATWSQNLVDVCATIAAAPEYGLYLHYAAGATPVTDLSSNELASFASDWVTYSYTPMIVAGTFPQNPIQVDVSALCP